LGNWREEHIKPIGRKEYVWGYCRIDSDWSESEKYKSKSGKLKLEAGKC
jgi:hypothetical protein